MMKKWVWVIMVICFSAFVTSSALAAEKPPVKMVGVAVLSGKVGAVPATGHGFADGAFLVNQRGGINGRKFEVILEDGQYDVPICIGAFNRALASHPRNELLFHCGWQTGVLRGIAEKVSETHLVCVDGSMATHIFDDKVKQEYPYYYSVGVPYGDQCGALFKYIKTRLHKGKKGRPKVGFVYIDAAAGKDPLEKMRMYVKKFDIDLVLEDVVKFTTTDYTPVMMKLRNAKADYVILWSWAIPVSTRFIKMARKYMPKTEILGLSYMAAELYFKTVGDGFDGIHAFSPYPRFTETNNKLVATVLETAKKQNHEVTKFWDVYLQGFLMSSVCAEGAIRADKAGNLSREGAREALEQLKDWDLFGMYGGKTIDYGTHCFPRARILRANSKTKTLDPATEWFNTEEYVK